MKYLILALLIMGTVGTVWEYRQYRKVEMENYGHGWDATASLKESETLVGPYVNIYQGYRIRYPKWWTVTEEGGKLAAAKEVTLAHPENPSVFIKVFVKTETLGVNDYADLISKKDRSTRDWDHVNNLVVLTWEKAAGFKQTAIFSKNGKIYEIIATCSKESAKEYELTFKEVFKSWITF